MSARKRTAVLISGRGSNLQALIDAASDASFPAGIALVLSNVAEAGGLVRAAQAGIPTATVPHKLFASREAFDAEVGKTLQQHNIELVCLAGFMRILSNGFVNVWKGRMVNIHPSLLPSFKGVDVHRRVLDSGVRITGCTVHFVVPELDSGPVIAQAAIPVLPDDTEQSIAARTLDAEHKLYPLALKMLAEGRVQLSGDQAQFINAPPGVGSLFSPSL
jgi:phosphoribosylglycinamide formyltransferase-1